MTNKPQKLPSAHQAPVNRSNETSKPGDAAPEDANALLPLLWLLIPLVGALIYGALP